jgi:site-specific recombinase XerD
VNATQQRRFDRLYQQHVNALHRQGKTASTIDVYARAVRRIAAFVGRCPDNLSEDELKRHFDALVRDYSWSTVKVDRNGLQFFYQHVLNQQCTWVNIIKPPRKTVLPDILSVNEIERLINATRELRYQTFLFTAYSMGLRLGEALNLNVGDIDRERMQVHVRLGKGQKDRLVTLPEVTLLALRRYWATHRHPSLLFPAGKHPAERHAANQAMSRSGVQRAIKAVLHSCALHKKITVHSLRHCYGTHLLEAGLSLRAIQHQMGHESPKTTALYTQLTPESHDHTASTINALVGRLTLTFDGEV